MNGASRPRRARGAIVAAQLAGGLALVAILLLAGAAPAAAHAQLDSSDPVASSVVASAPAQVVLRFDEPVEIDFGSLRVFGPTGRRVDGGGTHHPVGDDDAVAIGLVPHLPEGSYVVAWRVVSADSHPVHGAFVFSVGSATSAARAAAVAGALERQTGSGVVGALFWLVRFGAFAGLLVLVGVGAGVALAWPAGGRSRPVGRVLWLSWSVLVACTGAGIALQGVYAAALPLGDVLRPGLLDAVVHTRFGAVELLRLGLLLAAVPVILGIRGRLGRGLGRRRWWVPAGAAVGAGLLLTPALAGHASTGAGAAWSVALDWVHLAAAALWLGGLALLAVALAPLGDPADRAADPWRVARAVSACAFGAVTAVVATGIVQSVRQVGSWFALFETTYGRTLIVKVALVAVLVGVAAVSRRNLRRPAAGPARLRHSVALELGIGLAVLAVTALLVNAAPAKQAAASPFAQSIDVLGLQVNAIVSPARVGPVNEFHFYVLGPAGTPRAIPELDATISLPSRGVGPLSVPLEVAGPGHYSAYRVDIPFAGDWRLTVTVRTTAIDEQQSSVTLPVH